MTPLHSVGIPPAALDAELFELLGFRWNRSAVPTIIRTHSFERVCFHFHRMLPEFVWDARVSRIKKTIQWLYFMGALV